MSSDPLAEEVARLLLESKTTIAVAESCTGGLICHRLTNISGSSAYLERGLVTYSNEAKMEMLGVPRWVIEDDGAVSDACVRAMAEGVKRLAGTDLGLAVSGIAGPTGGSPEKPVGTVHIGLARGEDVQAWEYHFSGDRSGIKNKASDEALMRIRDYFETISHG